MDTNEAITFVTELFASVPNATSDMIDRAVAASRVADSDGRGPIDDGYIDTVDEWLAAALVADRLDLNAAITGQGADASLTEFSSEGATFKFGGARSWSAVAAMLRARSPRWGAPGIGVIEVPTGSLPFRPRSDEWWL